MATQDESNIQMMPIIALCNDTMEHVRSLWLVPSAKAFSVPGIQKSQAGSHNHVIKAQHLCVCIA